MDAPAAVDTVSCMVTKTTLTVIVVFSIFIAAPAAASDVGFMRQAALETFEEHFGVDMSDIPVTTGDCPTGDRAVNHGAYYGGDDPHICFNTPVAEYSTMLHEYAHAYESLYMSDEERAELIEEWGPGCETTPETTADEAWHCGPYRERLSERYARYTAFMVDPAHSCLTTGRRAQLTC